MLHSISGCPILERAVFKRTDKKLFLLILQILRFYDILKESEEAAPMASENEIKRNIKDSVFSALFREPKYLRKLCKVLKPDVTEEELDSIRDVTIENILINGLHNDLAFTVGMLTLCLFEAQSTPSYNIPYRMTSYCIEKLREFVIKNQCNLYGKKAVRLPVPRFYMVYTGTEELSEDILTLTDTSFGGVKGSLEAEVKVIHLSRENNILDQYIKFTRISDEQVRINGRSRENMARIIDMCVEQDILCEFLTSRKSEVINIMDVLFNEEYAQKMYVLDEKKMAREEGRAEGEAKGRAEGEAKGRAEGEAKGRVEGMLAAVRSLMSNMGTSAEKALSMLGIPQNEWNTYLPRLG